MAIPPKGSAYTGDSYMPAHCDMYKINSSYLNTKLSSFSNICSPDMFTKEIVQCDEWIFDDERTIVKDVMYIFLYLFFNKNINSIRIHFIIF